MPRKRKINVKSTDRADQRARAQELQKKTDNLAPLQSTPPRYMRKTEAGRVWRSVVPILQQSKTIKEADVRTVEALCTAYMLYREAFKSIQDVGIQTPIYKTVQDQMGQEIGQDFVGYKKNPAVTTMDAAINRIRQLSSDLGLTPTARAALLSLPDSNKQDNSPTLSDILNGDSDF